MNETNQLNNVTEGIELARERNLLATERTRLAAERTVSSWMRTGLASVGGGFAIIRLIVFQNFTHRLMAHGIGEILIMLGIFIFVFSLKDYRKTSRKLELVTGKKEWLVDTTMYIFILVSLFLFFVTLTE